ncbi:uncharacterized protein LOC116847472 [Odontomachus brunneus]|uniref:uncharacterized protein LOC116847472 n=1 Tax=Odontomachus brunneus TaxID=486640 RepID=UPI0013F1FF47|nr:uncharacterized protein LOC116847472 [Odontomachus brunneus]
MQFLRSLIYLVILLCTFFFNVYCDEMNVVDDVTQPPHDLEKINSFFYKSEEELNSPVTQESSDNKYFKTIEPCSCKESDERITQETVFYKRMVAVLLSNLVIERVDDKLIGTLSMEASSSEFNYLQNFVEGQGSIKEVDRILDNIIKQSHYPVSYYVSEMSYYFGVLSELLIQCTSVIKEHWDITIISLIVISSFLILRKRQWSRSLVIFLLFDVIVVASFFITWWRLIQEAEIKIMAAQAQFAEMPIACQPHKMGILDKIVASFSRTNECEKYYEALLANPKLQVTPMIALTHFLSTVIFYPLSYFGIVMSEFIENATSKMNVFYAAPVTFLLYVTFCICLILLPFSLIGGSFNFGIGPFFRFGINGRERQVNQERIDRIYENTSQIEGAEQVKQLKSSEKMKQITLEQDLAGGDACDDKHHLDEKQEVKEVNEKKEGDGDC